MTDVTGRSSPLARDVDRRYALGVLWSLWGLWAVLSVPVMLRAYSRWRRVEPFWDRLGMDTGIGDGKVRAGQLLAVVAVVGCGIAWVALLKHPGRLKRLGVFVAGALVMGASAEWLYSARTIGSLPALQPDSTSDGQRVRAFLAFRRLDMIAPSVSDRDLFSKRALGLDTLASFDDLYERIESHFRANEARWRRDIDILRGEASRATFYMNAVSGLWHFGNKEQPDRVGCVGGNEEMRSWDSRGRIDDARTYLRSSIGCCTDYAFTLKYLLDRAGIRNRLVTVPGHVFNEALLDGGWRALDPTVNVYYSWSWGAMVEGRATRPTPVILFPLAGLEPGDSHRERVGTLRSYVLFLAGQGAGSQFSLEDSLPPSFATVARLAQRPIGRQAP